MMNLLTWAAASVVWGLSGLQPADPSAPPPASPGSSTPASGESGVITISVPIKPAAESPRPAAGAIATAEELLSALETADKDLRTLRAEVTHLKRESELVGNRTQEQRGHLYYRVAPAAEGGKKFFQVDFTDLFIDNVKRKESRTFIFDGQWLVERQPEEKQIFKRQLAPPGKAIDPLALGEGHFPIPIGQKKDRINERFDAALVPPEQEFPLPPGADPDKPPALPEFVKDSYQLKLTPKRGTNEFRDYREIRVWYRKGDLLPRMARTVNVDDSTDDVILSRVETNKDLPAGVFDTTVPEGWNAEISEYRAPGADE